MPHCQSPDLSEDWPLLHWEFILHQWTTHTETTLLLHWPLPPFQTLPSIPRSLIQGPNRTQDAESQFWVLVPSPSCRDLSPPFRYPPESRQVERCCFHRCTNALSCPSSPPTPSRKPLLCLLRAESPEPQGGRAGWPGCSYLPPCCQVVATATNKKTLFSRILSS